MGPDYIMTDRMARRTVAACPDVADVFVQALKSAPVLGTPVAHKAKKNLAQFLLESPLPGSGLKLRRQKDYPRQVDL